MHRQTFVFAVESERRDRFRAKKMKYCSKMDSSKGLSQDNLDSSHEILELPSSTGSSRAEDCSSDEVSKKKLNSFRRHEQEAS